MTDTETYIQRLLEFNPLREPLIRRVIQSLGLQQGSRGLDAGCGIGLHTVPLAEAVGPTGHVTGLDRSKPFLEFAESRIAVTGLPECISFRQGDIGRLPFYDDCFDWVWSVDCIGYPAGDPLPELREIARVLRPGGTVAILGWTSQSLLPGYQLLEARLNATCSGYAPYIRKQQPESHFMRLPRRLAQAGLTDVRGETFTGDVQMPFGEDIRAALVSLFEMLWGERRPETAQMDWKEYGRLCDPASPDFILNLDDYYAFFTYTMFRGRIPG